VTQRREKDRLVREVARMKTDKAKGGDDVLAMLESDPAR